METLKGNLFDEDLEKYRAKSRKAVVEKLSQKARLGVYELFPSLISVLFCLKSCQCQVEILCLFTLFSRFPQHHVAVRKFIIKSFP